ncbi:YciI family protein [Pyxidicoccus sp. 3LFB2]
MLYAVLCYNDEKAVGSWSKEEDDQTMARLEAVQAKVAAQGRLGPVARLMPTKAARTLRKGREAYVTDGPFAETKEQILGFYVIDCETPEDAEAFAKELSVANPGTGCYELRPIAYFRPSTLK